MSLLTHFGLSRSPKDRLVLIHCPTFSFESYNRQVLLNRGYYCYPPRAIACLATALKGLVEVDLLDLNYLLLKRLRSIETNDPYNILINLVDEYLQTHSTNYFGVSTGVIVPTIFDNPRHPFLEVLHHLKELKRGLVIAGGAPATIEARNLIEGGWADIVVKGEAEERLQFLFGNHPPISGICYLKDGQYAETEGSSEMVHFEHSLIPIYSQIAVEDYHKVGSLSPFSRMAGVEKPYSSIQLIRGCRMKCTFCGLTQYRGSNEVCKYPVDLLFEEIEYLVNERGITHFAWQDEDLLAGKEELKYLLRTIINAGVHISWEADIGVIAVYLDEELLELMRESGCVGFRIGVESGNEEILRRIRKPATKPKLRKISAMLQNYPFFVVGLYMLGFKNETYGQIYDTMKFAIELNLSWSHFCVYQEIKETDLSRKDIKSFKSYRDWLPSMHKVVGTSEAVDASTKLTAKEVLNLPADEVHDPKHRQELWFAFNLICNYLSNKNLKPGGNPLAFVRWLKGLQMTYPAHPVMSLFLALGHGLLGETPEANRQFLKALHELKDSPYWVSRFSGYGLDKIVDAYPVSNPQDLLRDVIKGYQCKSLSLELQEDLGG